MGGCATYVSKCSIVAWSFSVACSFMVGTFRVPLLTALKVYKANIFVAGMEGITINPAATVEGRTNKRQSGVGLS